jgi:ribosomal protein S19E (S16A)
MKSQPKGDALTADDLECLWAIARRATIQDRLVESRGRQLQKRGLIELTHQWPTLTPEGRRVLKEFSAQTILDLHRESNSGE